MATSLLKLCVIDNYKLYQSDDLNDDRPISCMQCMHA